MVELLIWLSGWFIGLPCGMAMALWFAIRHTKKQMPFRWDCPEEGCEFSTKSSDMTTTLAFADTHENHHRQETE